MAKIKVTQVKSYIKRPEDQKRTLQALGLHKIGQVVEHDDTSVLSRVRLPSRASRILASR